MKIRTKPNAFTFIDLLVSLSLLTLVTSLVLPSLKTNHRSSGEVSCMGQMRAHTQGMFMYQQEQGTMPAAIVKQESLRKAILPAWFDLLKTEGFLGDEHFPQKSSCPLVMRDLPNYIQNTTGRDDTKGNFTYSMNAFLGGWDSSSSKRNAEYDFKPLNTSQVASPASTVLIAEMIVPHTLKRGRQRRYSYIADFAKSGIPHIYENLNTKWDTRGVVLEGRLGTANMAFVDGSVRSVRGTQSSQDMVQGDFADGWKLTFNLE